MTHGRPGRDSRKAELVSALRRCLRASGRAGGGWTRSWAELCRLRNAAAHGEPGVASGAPSGAAPRRERGAALILSLVFMVMLLGVLSLTIDLGALLVNKEEAVKAAEMCALRAAAEMYRPDYVDLVLPPGDSPAIPGLDPDKWWSQFRETVTRDAARNLGLLHVAGWTAAHTPYVPDIHLNANNLAAGDIRLGNWNKAAGGPFSFAAAPADILVNASLPRALVVSVRRVIAPDVAGVSEGADPIPLQFADAMGFTLGMEATASVTVKLDPAAVLGTGAVVPMSDGDTAVTGAMPMALKHTAVVRRQRPGPPADIPASTWITSSDPNIMVTVRITRDGTAATGQGVAWAGAIYLVSYASPMGGTPLERIQRRLRFVGQKFVPPPAGAQEPPPAVWLGMLLSGPGQGDGPALNNGGMNGIWNAFFRPAGDDDFVNRTFLLPVVMNGGANNRQTLGFLRVYCEGARRRGGGGGGGGADRWFELDLRLAASAGARNSGTLNSLARLAPPVAAPAAVLAQHFALFWITDAVDGLRAGPRTFGVACASKTTRYRR